METTFPADVPKDAIQGHLGGATSRPKCFDFYILDSTHKNSHSDVRVKSYPHVNRTRTREPHPAPHPAPHQIRTRTPGSDNF